MRDAPGNKPIKRLANKAEWIERTAAAAKELIEVHRYRKDDFIVVDEALSREGIALGAASFYPSAWCELGGRWVRRVNPGVTLHWPSGTNYWGEGFDAEDPICLLAEVRFWDSVTAEDMQRLLEAS